MIDFDEEIKKFKPSLEVDDIENAVYILPIIIIKFIIIFSV